VGESAFADHLIENNHNFIEGLESLIHQESSFFKRLALENIEIARHVSKNDITVLNRIIPEDSFINNIYNSNQVTTQP